MDRCGWQPSDVLLFGFGQGGSLALGLASRVRVGPRVEEVIEEGGGGISGPSKVTFKGVVSIGDPCRRL